MNNEKTLIVCRDFVSVNHLDKISFANEKSYVLASDDQRVQEKAKDYPWIQEICWLEKAQSFYAVSTEVIQVLNEINSWLNSLADGKNGFSKDLLFWLCHCEGGMTTQRIQDALLLVSSYVSLIEEYKINEIILLSIPGAHWEDEVLIQTAMHKNVKLNLSRSYYFSKLIMWLKQNFEILGRVIYYLFNFLRIKLNDRFAEECSEPNKTILFQISSSAQKHVNHIVPVMHALKKNGYSPLALCWRLKEPYFRNDCVKQISSEKLHAEGLELYASFFCLPKVALKTVFTWCRAFKKRSDFLSRSKLKYKGVSFQMLLWPSIRFFIFTEVWPRFIFKTAILHFLSNHQFVAVKPWGADFLAEGKLLLSELNKKNHSALTFWWQRHSIEDPYHFLKIPLDLYLAANNLQKRDFEKMGIPSSKIELSASSFIDNVRDFIKSVSVTASFNLLGVPTHFSRYVLFDSGFILRGFYSTREQVATLNALIKFAQAHTKVALIIKPHSGHKTGILEQLLQSAKPHKNIFLLNKDSAVAYHALNVADLLITKYSTLGLEAMMFNKPVISVILDLEERFKVYDTSADYFDNLEQMIKLLERISLDEDFFAEWKADHAIRRKKFMESLSKNGETLKLGSSEAIASKIVNKISSRQSC